MKKSELIKSILILAKHVGNENGFKHLISTSNIPKTVELLVYQLFLIKFNSYNSPPYLFNAYTIIHQYATEMNENGFVRFQSEESN